MSIKNRVTILAVFAAAMFLPILALTATAQAAVISTIALGLAWVDVGAWFKHDSWFALPRYVWALLTGLALVENLLGRSKNPRVRSVFAALATVINWFVEKSRIAAIPVFGAIIVNVLRAITGDKDGNGVPDADEAVPPGPTVGR